MKLVRRHPDCGYLDSWLWLPRKYVSEAHVHSALVYEGLRKKDVIRAWRDEPHHIRVPRNFYSLESLGGLSFPVFDARFRDFPRVQFRSRVTLDAKEPSKTYQRDGSRALLACHDGILCLRCGAGKTVTALHSAAKLGVPFLVVVNETGLAEQWIEEIETFLGVPREDIGFIGDGQFDWKKPITIGIVNSLAKRALEGRLPVGLTKHFGLVIFDEAHIMAAPWFNNAAPPFHGRRWGLSATPTRDDGYDSLLRYTMGEVVYTYLIPDEKPTVYFQRLPTMLRLANRDVRKATHDVTGEFHFGMCYGYLAREKPTRTAFIASQVRRALEAGRQCLVLTHSVDMVVELGTFFPTGGIVWSDIPRKERRRRITECNPVISIMQLGKQALNKPSLNTLFICEPFSKEGVLQQTMGRVLRKFPGDIERKVIFYEDANIKPLSKLCSKLRRSLNTWPEIKGGRIPYTIVKRSGYDDND